MVEIDEKLVSEAMGYLTEGYQEALNKLLCDMTDDQRSYFLGYVAGYTEAVRHLAAAESDKA